ncbi:hypothetical protein [Blastococcus saxobsidens]|uniref:Uncharacterized protein n=1 Tax=Blastococcus saxobsidens (strain DD2) TaxID=1146883 RepID=H6RRX6_BLASD|nr:hypothetical protein [Blastococcus saxobsidens]CCG02970.1 conserved membrane protein of unknown function [Blastococcus saxobsidens DD2]
MTGVLAVGPVAVFVLVGVVVLVVLAATAVRRRQLAPAVADARRYGLSTNGLSVALGGVAGVAVALGDLAGRLGSGVSIALAPLVFGVVHTAVLGVGEKLWPRPRGAVRTAGLTPRRFPSSVRWLRTIYGSVVLVVVATCAAGWSTAGADGRSFTTTPPSPPGLDVVVGPSTTGPYPGDVFALPALIGTGLLVLLTWLTVQAALNRSAVPADEASERTLRGASIHRVLRGSTSALLLLLAGLWFVAGAALHTAAQDTLVGIEGATYVIEGGPGLEVIGVAAMIAGGFAAVAALVLLLLPAPRLRPAPPAPPAAQTPSPVVV